MGKQWANKQMANPCMSGFQDVVLKAIQLYPRFLAGDPGRSQAGIDTIIQMVEIMLLHSLTRSIARVYGPENKDVSGAAPLGIL